MVTKAISEIFAEFVLAPTRNEKIGVLRRNNSFQLECVLRGAFNPNVKYTVNKVPSYRQTVAPEGFGYSNIAQELSRIYMFEVDNPQRNKSVSQKRMNEILIQILESMDVKEAKIFSGMLEKNLGVPGLDYKIVKESFPNLLP